MMAAVDEAKPDLIHANWTYEYGLTATRQSRYPYVLTVHDHAFHCLRWLGRGYLPLYLITQYVLHRARHLVAVSPYVGDYLEKKVRRPVPVIPNLVPAAAWQIGESDTARRRMAVRARGVVRVVSVLNWSELKNVKRALLAVRLARQRAIEQTVDIRFTLLGPGLKSGGPADCWAKEHDCGEGVTFKGEVHHKEALEEIAASDVLFHPSHEESHGCPISEAMAMRVPVVACWEAGGSRWLCGEDRGILCDGYNPLNMAEQILDACLKPSSTRCDAAHAWLAGLTADDKVLAALTLAYARACARRP
jgi:glycosyltransferase involved in cell wall biosynthesis